LRKHIPGERESGLAEALLLGYRQDLDPELNRVYANTGAVHVIAISGMHLGLIYLLLGILLKPLEKKRQGRWLRALQLTGGLWLFSLLAGASPSVLRAAVMFTCLVLGETLRRSGSVYNTLAFSAFVLLLINPFWLWDAGFQLSYAAVISILLFQRPLYHLLYIKNKWTDAVWKLSTVTLAAQVFTAAISLYHFHQFPIYFWLSNLVAVPLSSIVLIGEILLCGLFFWPVAAGLLGELLSLLIRLMNGFVEWVDALPFAVWEALQLSAAQTLLLLCLPAGVAWSLFHQARNGLRFAAICLLLLLGLRAIDFYQRNRQQLLIVYQAPRLSGIDLFRGRNLYAWGDSALLTNAASRRFFLEPARILYRAGRREETILPEKGWWLLCAGTQKIWLVRSAPGADSLSPTGSDLLLLSGKKAPGPRQLPAPFYRQVVADAAVPARVLRYWQQHCDSLKIPFHAVSREGAFVMPLH
jgi:competence protein ComEC